ncbi:MAG: hypothetical protein BMS9Abin31_0150 [Gammaproteobacteria bacterium]|nr:MAG: hypothetical protein BMS9Abin31_0150 [Gammaproteobacteria bacterium]
MQAIIKAFKSRTIDMAVLTAAAGAAVQYLPMAKNAISPDHYGFIMIGLGVLFAVLRAVTKTSLADK